MSPNLPLPVGDPGHHASSTRSHGPTCGFTSRSVYPFLYRPHSNLCPQTDHGTSVRTSLIFAIGPIYRQHCAECTQRYLVLLGGRFEVLRPAGATRCTDGGDTWRGGVDRRLLYARYHPIAAGVGVLGPKTKTLNTFLPYFKIQACRTGAFFARFLRNFQRS